MRADCGMGETYISSLIFKIHVVSLKILPFTLKELCKKLTSKPHEYVLCVCVCVCVCMCMCMCIYKNLHERNRKEKKCMHKIYNHGKR